MLFKIKLITSCNIISQRLGGHRKIGGVGVWWGDMTVEGVCSERDMFGQVAVT